MVHLKGHDHLENLDIDGQLILEMYLRKMGWADLIWIHLARIGTSGGIL
jgi:hypothetical protein